MENKLLKRDRIDKLLESLNEWKVFENHHLFKEFEFSDLNSAAGFASKIGELGNRLNHHADVNSASGNVEVKIFAHSAGGLTEKDFKLAMEIDKLRVNYLK